MPTTPDALSMKTSLLYSLPEARRFPSGKWTIHEKLKTAMIAEASLISANLKVFLGCTALVALGAADIVADGNEGWESKGIQGALILVVGYLFRLIITERKAYEEKISKLYERIIRNGGNKDEEDEPRARRARGPEREP